MHSIRASMQSVTAKRLSSEQHRESIINSSAILGGKTSLANMSIINNSIQMTSAAAAANCSTKTAITTNFNSNNSTTNNDISGSSNNVSKTMTTTTTATAIAAKKSLVSNKSENYVQMGNYDMLSFNADSLDGYDNYAMAMRVSSKKSVEHKLLSNTSMSSTFEFNEDDCIAEDDEVPPALPIKTRGRLNRRDRMSTYDNVDETDEFPK